MPNSRLYINYLIVFKFDFFKNAKIEKEIHYNLKQVLLI